MFNRDGHLTIFEQFEIDPNLPKYRPKDGGEVWEGEGDMVVSRNSRRRQNWPSVNNSAEDEIGSLVTKTLFSRLMHWFKSFLDKEAEPTPTMTILQFFSAVKKDDTRLSIVAERAKGYEDAIARARRAGQVALVEQLQAGEEAVRAETRLHVMGLTRVVTEATLVEFVKKSPKGLRLDWVKNFTRMIPYDILSTKVQCDEDHIFDNYVVLHYDPTKKSWAETQADVEARKDPILFGVLKGRRQLYPVGDWVDEHCDLSLDQIADVLGRRGEQEMDVNSYQKIDRG